MGFCTSLRVYVCILTVMGLDQCTYLGWLETATVALHDIQ